MSKQNHEQHAFTLLELLLVLLVIVGIIIVARNQYEKYALRKDIAIVEQDVQLLFDQLDRNFYSLTDSERENCEAQSDIKIVDDWSQILSSSLIRDISTVPVHPDFRISCKNPKSDAPAQLVITASLNIPDRIEPDQASWYAKRLGGELSGSDVVWTKIPAYMHAGKDPYWILSGQLEQFKKSLSIPTAYDMYVSIDSNSFSLLSSYFYAVDFIFKYDDGSGQKEQVVNLGALQDALSFSEPIQRNSKKVTIDASLTCRGKPDRVLSSINFDCPGTCTSVSFVFSIFSVNSSTQMLMPFVSGDYGSFSVPSIYSNYAMSCLY